MAKLHKIRVQVSGDGKIALGHASKSELAAAPAGQNENVVNLADTSDAKRQKIECEVGDVEFQELKSGARSLYLWSMPAADCSILGPGVDRYSGLYKLPASLLGPMTDAGPGFDGGLTTKGNQILVRESAIVWTARKMTENLKSPMVRRIQKEPWGNTGQNVPKAGTKEGTMGAMGHPDDGFKGTAMDVGSTLGGYGVTGQSGNWDLKPTIGSIWGQKLRFGNENWILYYDVLSNVHFGYIGAASSMPLNKLVELAGVKTFGNKEDPEDYLPTKIGHDLYAAYPNGITGPQLFQELKRYRGFTIKSPIWSVQKIS